MMREAAVTAAGFAAARYASASSASARGSQITVCFNRDAPDR